MTLARLDSLAAAVLDVLWRASWQAAVLVAMVLIVQWLLRGRLSARWRYNLWLLVLLRLIVPMTPQSPLSIFNLTNRFVPSAAPAPSVLSVANVRVTSPPLAVSHLADAQSVVDAAPLARSAKSQASASANVNTAKTAAAPIPWRLILAGAWIAGTLILLARIAFATIRLSRAVRRMTRVDASDVLDMVDCCRNDLAIHRRVIVLACNELPAPALMGVIRPRLLLPRHVLADFAPAELRLILLHELGHLKRNDVLVNWLVSLLAVAHWFNPILWLAFAQLRADRELATDELVLSRTGDTEKFAYGDTIVKLLQSFSHARPHRRPAPLVGAVGILERAHLLRRRITMIAQFRHHARRWTALAAISMLALAGFGLTDAVRGDDAKPVASPQTAIADTAAAIPAVAAVPVAPTQPATTQPTNNERLNAIIDDVMAKMMAKTPNPRRVDFDAAMREVAKRIRDEKLMFNQNGQPMNERQINDEIERSQKLMERKAAAAAGGAAAAVAASPSQLAAPARGSDGVSAANAAAQRKLSQIAPEFNFDAQPFADVVDFLRDATELNFFVNWRALEAAGIDRNTPVSVRLKNVPFELALRYVLREAGAEVTLDFAVLDGIVNITTAEELAANSKVRVYNVSSLLKQMPTTLPSNTSEELVRTDKAAQLIRMISETVAPDSWRDAGGNVGSIREINGRLVIAQTEANHALITKLLEEIGEQDEPVAAQK